MKNLYVLCLQLFAELNTHTTGAPEMSAEMKTYYDGNVWEPSVYGWKEVES